jgi:subtilisin family serine protease
MKRVLVPILLLIAALPLTAATTSRYLVATRHGARAASLRVLHSFSESGDFAERGVRSFHVIDGFAADLTDDEAAALRRSPDVRYVSKVVERHIADAGANVGRALQPAPDASPYLHAQTIPYGIDMVHARDVWPLTKGSDTVNVAVLDTGIDYKHIDLAAHYAGGYNTFKQNNDPFDDHKHGTHVSGTIGALDNALGVVGVAPNVKLWALKVLDYQGKGSDETIVAALDWVMAKKHEIGGNWIISLSLGSRDSSDIEQEGFFRAINEGMLVVAAAGNDASMALSYPAAYPGVLAVGAVDTKGVRADFSNEGPTLGVVAPGVDVVSTVPTDSTPAANLTADNGTSFTAYQVTGSPLTDLTGQVVNCGTGRPQDFPMNVSGRIAVMQRGDSLTFSEKVRNAKAAGAVAAVIYNNGVSSSSGWSLIRPDCTPQGCVPYVPDVNFDWPLTIALSYDDGQKLLNSGTRTVTIGAWKDSYATLSGTSMATPHVSGVAALLWSLAPKATAAQVRDAITATAHDLGDPGYDPAYGYGLIDALAAAKQIAPAAFGLPVPPPNRRREVPH